MVELYFSHSSMKSSQIVHETVMYELSFLFKHNFQIKTEMEKL